MWLRCSLCSKNCFFTLLSAIFFELPITRTFFRFPLKVRVIGSRLYISGRSRRGPRGPRGPSPLFLNQTLILILIKQNRPLLSQGLDDPFPPPRPAPYLKAWIPIVYDKEKTFKFSRTRTLKTNEKTVRVRGVSELSWSIEKVNLPC